MIKKIKKKKRTIEIIEFKTSDILLELLKDSDTELQVEMLLADVSNKKIYVEIINKLLNELSEEKQERKHLERKLKEYKEEVEIIWKKLILINI